MESSTSLPALHALKNSGHATIPGSASFQSHLSSVYTQHRARPTGQLNTAASRTKSFKDAAPHSFPSTRNTTHSWNYPWQRHFGELLLATSEGGRAQAQAPRLASSSIFWMLYIYIFVSAVFFSASVYSALFNAPGKTAAEESYAERSSELNALATPMRLAKISALQPPPLDFEPFFLRSEVDAMARTACLWTSEDALEWIVPWTTEWSDPISVLVTTTSTNRTSTRGKVAKLLQNPALNASALFLHLLYLHPGTAPSPNAFLNLARLFAPTPTVVLVPGIHSPLSSTFLTSYSSPHPPILPTILSNATTTKTPTFPHPPLSPVLTTRTHPLWCTERFFAPASPSAVLARAADWDACLWQIHLDTFGRAPVLPIPHRLWEEKEPEKPKPSPDSLAVSTAIHHRLSTRYRAETCVLALKRQEALLTDHRHHHRHPSGMSAAESARVRWLKDACREWVGGAEAARLFLF